MIIVFMSSSVSRITKRKKEKKLRMCSGGSGVLIYKKTLYYSSKERENYGTIAIVSVGI